MHEKLPTPTCDVTNLPLPIAKTEPTKEAQFSFYDYHHHFHPKRHELLSDVAGLAVRYSRGQFLPRAIHDRYHDIFAGPALPESTSEQYRLCVLACAGVVPRQAIELLSRSEYRIIDLSSDTHAALADRRSIFIEGAWRADKQKGFKQGKNREVRKSIGRFFAQYALQQNIRSVVSERVIGEFLDESVSTDRRKELGNFILKEALDITIDDIVPMHSIAKEEGLITATNNKKPRKVIRSFFTTEVFPDYHAQVAQNLAS